jgi:hypothetical protein
MRRALALLLALMVAGAVAPAWAAITIVQDPTLVSAASSKLSINFASLPASGNKVIVAYAVRGAHPAFVTVSDNQGRVFIASHVNNSTTITGFESGLTHTTVGTASGRYRVNLSASGASHIVAKAWEMAGLLSAATAGPSGCWLLRDYPAGADQCAGGQGTYHAGTRSGRIIKQGQHTVETCSLQTTATAFVIAVVRIQSPTNLTHLNTEGAWTRCTGCPVTDDVNSVGVDIVYQLSAPSGTYRNGWTFDVPSDATRKRGARKWGALIARFDAAP